MSTDQLTPRELAERRITQEEAAEREERIAALEYEEERRRQREEEAAEKERKHLEAVARYDRLAMSRGELEDVAQEALDRLMETFAEIDFIDTEQLGLLSAAGKKGQYATFRGVWQTWAAGRILGHPDSQWNMTLRERDPMAATEPAAEEEEGEVIKGSVSPSSPDPRRKCAGTKNDGSACALPPMNDSDYCPAHDPTRAESRREAARVAGKARHGLQG